jgi:hypothetical protein
MQLNHAKCKVFLIVSAATIIFVRAAALRRLGAESRGGKIVKLEGKTMT